MPQLRQNIITGEWVVFAPERAKRPSDYISPPVQKKSDKDNCPFCASSKNSSYPERIEDYDENHTYLIENKFPAFINSTQDTSKTYKVEDEFYKMKLALGGHDVVVVREHEQELPHFTDSIWRDLITTFNKRGKYYQKAPNVEYMMPIYNHEAAAAASIDHPHAQIFASSIVPNIISRELAHTKEHYQDKGTCPFCDLIEHEKMQNTRVIFENEDFLVFCFYAARFPFETWVLPKSHQNKFEQMSESQINKFIEASRFVFSKLDEVLNNPPLNFFIHSSPLKTADFDKSYHWHLEVAPRLSNYGGYELGSGVIIDIIAPEQAAEYIRAGKKDQ